jgi:mono/diheme cytochrome c family protein
MPAKALLLLAMLALAACDRNAPPRAEKAGADAVARGQYLVRAGGCAGCHTLRDGPAYAGGRPIPTPFGTLYSSNITPDLETGIGKWSADDFWRALHEGVSRDGSLLYPAFPYTNYTKVRRRDADAMYAYLRTLPAVARPSLPPEMRFPYDKRSLLTGWRALYFKPGIYEDDPKQSLEWNRGAYLVQGLGHCGACHAARNAWGAVKQEEPIAGGLIPMLNWYAPSLTSSRETGLGDWEVDHVVDLLKTGVSARGAVFGPMSEVVRDSLQYLTATDIAAMTVYLKSQREEDAPDAHTGIQVPVLLQEAMMKRGALVYADRCADCHQKGGEGVARIYPPLMNNEAILMPNPVNAIRVALNGGFPPSTQGNPRPYGMPPFAHVLDDQDIASVVTYIRGSWGNHAPPVSPVEVAGARGVPLD